jgi:hypothetical protein
VAAFTVTLSPASTQTVTVNYATANGTASAGSDYLAASGTLTFAPGVTARPISVTVNGDTTVEPNETFAVTLSGSANAVIGAATSTGTITNDDTVAVPTVAVSAATVTAGSAVTVTVANAIGYPGDWIGLYATSAPDSNYLAWQFLNGTMTLPTTGTTSATLRVTIPIAPGTYNVRLFANNGKSTKIATSTAMTVAPPSAPSVTASPTTVNPGSLITVTVANGAGYVGDWVGMMAIGAPDSAYLSWQFLNGATTAPATAVTSATLQFKASMTPGNYEFRLFANNGTSIRVATTATITVIGPSAASVAVSSTTTVPGGPLVVTVANAAGYVGDWVGLMAIGAPDGAYLSWQYLNGATTAPATAVTSTTLHFKAPMTPGKYEFRLFANNRSSVRVATSSTVTVTP